MLQLAQELLQKDFTWLLVATVLVLAVGIVIWIYRTVGKNGNSAKQLQQSLDLEKRVDMLDHQITEIKAALPSMTKGIDEVATTANRFGNELSYLKGQFHELAKRLDSTPPNGNRRN